MPGRGDRNGNMGAPMAPGGNHNMGRGGAPANHSPQHQMPAQHRMEPAPQPRRTPWPGQTPGGHTMRRPNVTRMPHDMGRSYGANPRRRPPLGLILGDIIWDRMQFERLRRILVKMCNNEYVSSVEERILMEALGRYITYEEAPEVLAWVEEEMGLI